MLPHRLHQFDQMVGSAMSTASATATFDELMDIVVEKMASNAIEEVSCPSESDANDGKIDGSSADGAMHAIKLDDLEYLPANILVEICDRTADIGLMHLAEISPRFANISKIFVINGERLGGDSGAYLEKWNRFGSAAQSMYMNCVENIDENHWTMQMLQPHINHITKLTFDSCTFNAKKVFIEPLDHITHLTYRHRYADLDEQTHNNIRTIGLPKCGSLQKLELHYSEGQYFSWKSLDQIIRDNSNLQSLLLYDLNVPDIGLSTIVTFIAGHLNGIKELALMMDSAWSPGPESDISDQLFKAFAHLESLALSIYPNTIQLLHRFGAECVQIKHFGLHIYGAYSEAEWQNLLGDVARSFQRLESFHYYSYESIKRDVQPIVELLPKLRHLKIQPSYQDDIECSDALPLLRNCATLQKITVVFPCRCDGYPETFLSAQFFDEFIGTGKPNACIEIEECNRIIGSVTVNGIIWRHKLMHWIDCDKNGTNVNLLDLADHEKADEINLLDRVCEYLDVASLALLADTNEQSKALVKRYVKNHSKKRGMFVITDEIYPFETLDIWYIFDELELTQYVTNLKVCTVRSESKDKIVDAIQSLVNIRQLSIFDGFAREHWTCALSGISHVEYGSSQSMEYSELHHIIETFPDAETIEFKNAGLFYDSIHHWSTQAERNECRNVDKLKKFKFNYRGETQTENLKKIFKNTNTQLIPIYPTMD